MAAYTASKAAVVAFTIALAEEVAKLGILVNAVAPSTMDTPANRAAMPKGRSRGLAKGRGSCGNDPVSRLAAERSHARRDRAGVWTSLKRIPINLMHSRSLPASW